MKCLSQTKTYKRSVYCLLPCEINWQYDELIRKERAMVHGCSCPRLWSHVFGHWIHVPLSLLSNWKLVMQSALFAALSKVRRSESAALIRLYFPFPLSGAFYPAGSSDLFITVISLLSWRRNRIPWTTWWRDPQTNLNCETEIILSFVTLARNYRRGQSDTWAVCDRRYRTLWSIQL